MSSETDESQKTESPTEHKLEEAFKKGQVTVSREIVHWFMLMMAAGLLSLYLPQMGNDLKNTFAHILENSHHIFLSDLAGLFQNLLGHLAIVFGLPLGAMVVAAVSATLIQTRLNVSAENMIPKFSKLSPMKGLERILGVKALVEFLKGLIKITIIICLVIWNVGPDYIKIVPGLPGVSAPGVLNQIHEIMAHLMIVLASVMTIIAGLDYGWQKFQHLKGLRMSKHEIKEEHKELEGDPLIKMRQRRLRNDRARKKMMAAVPTSTVVITNPTHYAVALSYSLDSPGAPKVVAKGMDFIALKIRELATENNVPLVENPPLARALYASVPLEGEIPREHYEAVAQVIRYIMKLDQRQ